MRVTPVAYKLEQSVMGQKMCFSDSLFGARTKNYNNFHYFLQKKRENTYCHNVKLQLVITPDP